MKKFLSLLLLLATSLCFAQINFEPGSFTTNNGEIVNCLIKNVAWKNNPTTFQYKLTEDGTETQKNVTDTQKFNVGGYFFERYTVEMERSAVTIGNLDNTGKPNYKTETLFLKVLVSGNISLYAYEDGNMKKYFYKAATDAVPVQLLYKRYEENLKIKEYNRYQYQLSQVLNSPEYSLDSLNRLRYDETSLKELFLKYNGVDGKAIDQTQGQNKSKFALKVTAGVHSASLETNTNVPGFSDNYDFGTKAVFSGGFEAEWILPFNNNKWSLFANPYYQSYKKDDRKPVSSAGTLYGWKAEASYVSVPVGIRYYMFLNQNSKIFLNLAYSINLKTGGEISYNSTVFDISNRQGWIGGVGYNYGKIGAELRYNVTRNLFNYVYRTADYTTV